MPLRSLKHPFPSLPAPRRGASNPYLEKIIKEKQTLSLPVLSGEELRGKAGGWREYFKKRSGGSSGECAALWLEIGCHRGNVLGELMRRNPRSCVLGIDITLKRVYLAAHEALTSDQKRGAVIYGNAKALRDIFSEGELDGVVVFFPDPWSAKERQRKHRLWSLDFVHALRKVMSVGAFLWCKSDDGGYFRDTHELLCEGGFKSVEGPLISDPHHYTSIFEKRCLKQGLKVYEGWYQVMG